MQNNQEWQPSDSKVATVEIPTNLYNASTPIAGSISYTCPDEVQNARSMTPATSCSKDVPGGDAYNDEDGDNPDQA